MNPVEKSSPNTVDLEPLKKMILDGQEYLDHPFNHGEKDKNYIFELTSGNKRLVYFGSHHTNNPQDPMFEEIQTRFKELQPEIVYVEGMQEINDHKELAVEKRKDTTLEETIKDGENLYTLKLAIDAGVEFESPEPKQFEVIQHLLGKGFSGGDIFKEHMYSIIAQYQRHYAKEKTLEGCKKYLEPYFSRFQKNSRWKLEDLERVKQELFADLDLDATKYRDQVVPNPRKEAVQTIINQVSRNSSRFRDEYGLERIAEGLKNHDKLFVVYGSGHAVRLEPALRALLVQ
ncbi:MAG: hypothetical protein AAB460_00900 [Patescibacteria group bacterium]